MTLTPQFFEYIPDKLEDGILYISERFSTAIHNCPCGCGTKAVTAFSNWGEIPWSHGWQVTINENVVSMSPSLLNPCKTHYFIENNEIRMC